MLPSVEGAADGWSEDAAWNIDGDVPPSLSVLDGLLQFNSVLPGQQAITLAAGSTWAAEVDAETSYTFEVSLRVVAADAPNPGATLWFANGSTRLILVVGVDRISTFSGLELHAGDNSTDFVTIRMAYHASTGLYLVWRNDELIGDGVPDDGAAAGGRTAVFLIDCCTSVQVEGEFDYVCWDTTGAYAPGDDGGDDRPFFVRGNADTESGINITDGIFVLNFLFLGGSEPPCRDAADANGDNSVNITDGIYILNFLFTGGGPPPAPHPDCGVDPDDQNDDISCLSFDRCP